MNIGNVIKKYRKESGFTQEEMANRLGVTTPAVNKWENGNSNPDIELLAPIARLLHISLDTLLSFHENLTDVEITELIQEMDKMFSAEGYEKTYQWAVNIIKDYPNCNMLIWQVAVMLDSRRIIGQCEHPDNGHKHIPSQSVSEDARQRTAAFYAPSKTFNLAGLVGSYHIVYNSWWRDRILKESSLSHYNMMNVLSMHALLGAYQPEGYEWTDELCEVLSGNVSFACDYIDRHFKGVNVSRPEGTYMLFADCTDWCTAHGKTIEDVEKACWDVGVAVQDGRMFFGPCHLRMNLASPRSRIEEAFRRMDRYVFNR
jgi:transcriptional regulator with XRE-family HTH domain